MTIQENLTDAISKPQGANYIRNQIRNYYLMIQAGLKSKESAANSVRCLYAHYVFDDQQEDFEKHIKNLCSLGEFINTDDMITLIRGDIPIDGRYFHLSFDDGLDCLARNAVPILDQHNIPCIVFVNSALADIDCSSETRIEWEKATNYQTSLKTMDWKTLMGSGLEVGAHTRTHKRLSDISSNRILLEKEIFGCKLEVEAATGAPCKYFAWPYGLLTDIDELSIEVLKQSGFVAAFGVYRHEIQPKQTDLFSIPRHHFEPQWPTSHVNFFANGGMEKKFHRMLMGGGVQSLRS